MQIPYTIYGQRSLPADIDAGELGTTCVAACGKDRVVDIVRDAVRRFGVCPRGSFNETPWFVSESPVEDRDFFEQGMEKYFSLHFHTLSPRQLKRVDRLLSAVWHGK